MRICYILPNLNVGGQERLTLWLAQYLKSLGHEVCIVCLSGKGELVQECGRQSIELVIPGVPYRGTFFQLSLFVWLRRYFKRSKPDIIHSHAFEANYYSRISGLFLPFIFIAHEHNIYPNKRGAHFIVDRLLSRACACVICISKAVADFHMEKEKINADKIRIIWNGVPGERGEAKRNRMEIRNELGIPPHVPVLIATGSFKAQKGHRMLIRAFSRMKNSECILLLLGSGPLEEECRRLVDFHGLRNRIRFIGTVENVCDYLNASDIFVLSSHWEGFGLAVVEAAMARIPVVATAVDGVTEIVENQETAFLCCPETEALAARLDDALVCMVRDPGAVAVMCDKAYRRAREVFSFERMAGKILSLYQEVIANKAVSP